MKKTIIISLFSITVLAQWLVPLQMIWQEENIITKGTVYKFRTQPIDPTDPYRGKYITLDYEIRSFQTKDSIWYGNDKVFVYLKTDSLGFAQVDRISKEELGGNNLDFVEAEVDWYSDYDKSLHFHLPFDRFYMEEHKAKPAERIVMERNPEKRMETYAKVAVNEGEASLIDVMVNGISIADYVEQMDDE